jgi:AhpD family alkylhydroperoxidase
VSEDVKAFYEQWKKDMGRMKEEAPGAISGFGGLFQKVMGEGALTVREKELVALGIALGVRCTQCINLHVQKCLDAGATREQIVEAAAVALMMGGGPVYTNLPAVLDALDACEA